MTFELLNGSNTSSLSNSKCRDICGIFLKLFDYYIGFSCSESRQSAQNTNSNEIYDSHNYLILCYLFFDML